MQKYADIDNDSGVDSFEISGSSITIWFESGHKPYTYSYASAGQHHVETMKSLAQSGEGLHAYINKYVKDKFVR